MTHSTAVVTNCKGNQGHDYINIRIPGYFGYHCCVCNYEISASKLNIKRGRKKNDFFLILSSFFNNIIGYSYNCIMLLKYCVMIRLDRRGDR